MLEDVEAGAAQQRLGAGPVGNPPIRLVMRVTPLDELESRESRLIENRLFPERVVLGEHRHLIGAPLHRLEDQEISGDMLVNEVEGEQRMAQMVEHAHEKHDVEALAEPCDVIDRELAELDLGAAGRSGKAGLPKI